MDKALALIYDEIVAIAKGEAKKLKSAPRWGTASAASADGKVEILFDDGTSSTPCSTVTKVHQGDRVMVTVDAESRKATVTGNFSDPSATDSEVRIVNETAERAADAADAAGTAAAEAIDSASTAYLAAQGAQASADSAASNAQAASSAAAYALSKANEADTHAGNAQSAADAAQSSANAAQSSATAANSHANAALDQLGVVQDVIGVLTWASEHGSFTATSDTAIQDGKVYFTYDSATGDYTPVVSPQASSLSSYYELTVTEAMDDFIMSHLAVTSRGLWVLPSGIASSTTPATGESQTDSDARQASNYKMLMASDGVYVYDGSGHVVAKYGTSIDFATDRPFVIGEQTGTSYIAYTPSGGIAIGGGATFSSMTVDELIGTLDTKAEQFDLESLASNVDGLDSFVRGYTYQPTADAVAQSGVTYYERVTEYVYTERELGEEDTSVDGLYYMSGNDYVAASGTAQSGVTYYSRTEEVSYADAEVSVGDSVTGLYVYINDGSLAGAIDGIIDRVDDGFASQNAINDSLGSQIESVQENLEAAIAIDSDVPSVTVGYMDEGTFQGYRTVIGPQGMEIVSTDEKSVAMYGSTQRLGASDAPHMVSDGTALMFLPADKTDISDAVAYVKYDDAAGESYMYMTRARVVTDLEIGKWSWRPRANGNLSLKWIGGE